MDITGLTCYTLAMSRGPKPKPKELLMVNIGLKVPPEIKKEILEIVKNIERATPGFIARSLFIRGLLAYRADQKLEGPASVGKNQGYQRGPGRVNATKDRKKDEKRA